MNILQELVSMSDFTSTPQAKLMELVDDEFMDDNQDDPVDVLDDEFMDDSMDNTDDDQPIDAVAKNATDDPDRQGVIRTIDGAHLVYKRKGDTGYDELWIYNTTDVKISVPIRRQIISGSDIPPGETQTANGEQKLVTWSVGNAELIALYGLPN